MSNIRRSMMAASRGGGVKPYDAEIEYLESVGTASSSQYINTGIVPIDTPRIVITFVFVPGYAADRDIFGFASNTTPSFIGNVSPSGANLLFRYYRYYHTAGIGETKTLAPRDEITTLDAGFEIYVNGTKWYEKARESFAANRQSIYVYRGRTNTYAQIRVYAYKIYDGDVLMQDCIPVRVGQVGYMYDKISGQLFGNAGSGSFALGNDIN